MQMEIGGSAPQFMTHTQQRRDADAPGDQGVTVRLVGQGKTAAWLRRSQFVTGFYIFEDPLRPAAAVGLSSNAQQVSYTVFRITRQ